MPTDHNTWTCAETRSRLSDFVEGVLAPDELAAFDQHRAGCEACASLSARVAATVSTLHAMELLEAPPNLIRAILDRTTGAREESRPLSPVPAAQPASAPRRWFDWLSALAQPQLAYGVLTVVISTLVVSHALGIDWRRPTIADLNPENMYRATNRRAHLIYARGTKFVSDSRIVYEIQSALESEPAAESTPQPIPAPAAAPSRTPGQTLAPGQTESAPPAAPRDRTRASRRIEFITRAAARAASLMPAISVRLLP